MLSRTLLALSITSLGWWALSTAWDMFVGDLSQVALSVKIFVAAPFVVASLFVLFVGIKIIRISWSDEKQSQETPSDK